MRLRKKNPLSNFVIFDPRSLTKLQKECAYWKANAEGEKLAREAVQEELAEQSIYAEMGKLALKTIGKQIYNWHCMGKFESQLCNWYCKTNGCDYEDFCRLRAKVEEGRDNHGY